MGFSERVAAACTTSCDASDAWLHVVRGSGRDTLERVYQDTLAGRAHPTDGLHRLALKRRKLTGGRGTHPQARGDSERPRPEREDRRE